MPSVGIELKRGGAYKQVYDIIAHAMKVHNEQEGCAFNRTAKEITDEVFEVMVNKVEDAEDSCPLNQAGSGGDNGRYYNPGEPKDAPREPTPRERLDEATERFLPITLPGLFRRGEGFTD